MARGNAAVLSTARRGEEMELNEFDNKQELQRTVATVVPATCAAYVVLRRAPLKPLDP